MRIVIKKPVDNASRELYKNLSREVTKITKEVLGENYYTICCDNYNGDIECCSDIRNHVRYLKNDLKFSRTVNVVLIIALIIAIIL